MAILRRAPPPLPAQLARMAAHCSGDLAGLRDRALLLLAAVGLDGEQLRGLDREHVRLTDTGGAELLVLDGAGLQAPRRVLTLKPRTRCVPARRGRLGAGCGCRTAASGRCSARWTVGATSSTAISAPMGCGGFGDAELWRHGVGGLRPQRRPGGALDGAADDRRGRHAARVAAKPARRSGRRPGPAGRGGDASGAGQRR